MRHLDIDMVVEEIASESLGMLKPHVLMYYAVKGGTHSLEEAYKLASDYEMVVNLGYIAQRARIAMDTRRSTLRGEACLKLIKLAEDRAPALVDSFRLSMKYVTELSGARFTIEERIRGLEFMTIEDDKNLVAVLGLKAVTKKSSDLTRLEYFSEIAIMLARREMARFLIDETQVLKIMKQEALA